MRSQPSSSSRMPKFFCDYCGVHLTHDSFKGRKQHMYGGKHRNNVIAHYNRVAEDLQKQGHFPVGAPPAHGPGMMPVRSDICVYSCSVCCVERTVLTLFDLPLLNLPIDSHRVGDGDHLMGCVCVF